MVYKEVRGLHQAAYFLAVFALASQLLALVRDRLLAHNFGAGADLDIYYAAFRIPDLLFVLFASVLSVYVLIPFVSKKIREKNDQAGGELLSQILTVFMLVYAVLGVACFCLAPYFIPRLFPNIVDQHALINLTRILLLQPFFLGISNLFGVVTQLGHRFIIYAISPLLYNIGIILGILFLYPVFGLIGLGIGVVIGALLHWLIQLPFVYASDFKIRLNFHFNWQELGSIFMLSIPRAVTLSMQQILMLVLIIFASAMTAGSVSIFQFAYNLQSVPLAIIGVSYSVAAFPVLADLYSKALHKEFSVHILTAIRHIIFWSVPIIVLIIVLRAQFVRVVLGSGAFDWADTRLTAAVLAVLVVSLLAQSIYLIAVRAFYAAGETRIPFFVTLFCSALTILFAYVSIAFYDYNESFRVLVTNTLRLDNVIGSEILAIAFGYSLAMLVQAIFIIVLLSSKLKISLRPLIQPLWHAALAALVGGLAAYVTLNFVVEGVDQNKFIGVFIQGLLAGLAGLMGVIMTYVYFRSVEFHEIYTSFHRKLLKVKVIAPQEEVL